MRKIFISYRRRETIDITGRISDWLVTHFGVEAVFRDVTSIPYGEPFRDYIKNAVRECSLLLVVIGNEWLNIRGETGLRRIDEDDDPVRLEIEEAIKHKMPILPVLVQETHMPRTNQLPASIAMLSGINGIQISSGRDFPKHMQELIDSIECLLKRHQAPRPIVMPERAATPLVNNKPASKTFLPRAADPTPTTAVSASLIDSGILMLGKHGATAAATQVQNPDTRPVTGHSLVKNTPILNGDTVLVNIARSVSKISPDARNLLDGFEWCDIPAGTTTMQTMSRQLGWQTKTYQVEPFRITSTVITDAQYAVFTAAHNGYRDMRWWQFSPYAVAWRQKNPVAMQAAFKGDNLPRVNITWFEAMAFCYWLSAQTGLTVRLPSEQQWQRAAQSNDQREYPWGNVFDASRTNTQETKPTKTTPVDYYRQGRSYFGLYDMAGNVQQWCITEYASGNSSVLNSDETRVVRGGSWQQRAVRITQRARLKPDVRSDSVGFRIVLITHR
jgi:formylglycine-generating enzyme required for sulfatase activity